MFDLYFGLPSWLRTMIALVFLTGGLLMTWYGHEGRQTTTQDSRGRTVLTNRKTSEEGAAQMFRVGLVVTGIGTGLLFVCGQDDAEKSGYHF